MARSLHSFDTRYEEPSSPPLRYLQNERDEQMNRWEMRISLGQVVVLWAAIAGMMVTVFLFGLWSGREQGVTSALEEYVSKYGEPSVRLPIVQAVPLAGAGGELENSVPSSQLELSGIGVESAKELGSADSGTAVDTSPPPVFDFSGQADADGAAEDSEPAAGANDVAVGLATRPTLELFEKTETANSESNEESAKVNKTIKVVGTQKKPTEEKVFKDIPKVAPKPRVAKTEVVIDGVAITPPGKLHTGKRPPLGWYIQASAATDMDEAFGFAKDFVSFGFDSAVEQARVRERTYYRVLIGPYPNREAARGELSKVKRTRVTKGEPFLKRVK